jgi:putative transposase
MREATTARKMDYFRLPRPLWRKLKKHLPKKRNKSKKRGGRPRVSDRAVANAIWYVLWSGCQWKAIHREWFGVSASVVHERFQWWRRMGLFEKLMNWMVEHYAKESGGISWKWQAMDSKNSPAPLGGQKTGKNPTDRGKQGAKINLLVDERGAPLSVVLTGANRHDKVSAVELIVSIALKRPAHKQQHLCADKAYDASDVREFASSGGYTTHIKVNPRKKDSTHIPHPQTNTSAITCSCLQRVSAVLSHFWAIRAYLEKRSIDKSAVSTDHCVCLAGAPYERNRAFEMIEYPLLQVNYS